MGDFFRSLLIYLIGGVTFVPLTILALFLHAWLTLEHVPETPREKDASGLLEPDDDGHNVRAGADAADEKLQKSQEKEYAGYFAVCREWVPGGINGKPPERTTPAGEVIAEESPSVYQSMYRSLFDRRQGPTMEVSKTNGRTLKKANNIFYVVLRHGHLMLYEDSEQIEVRYVISLAQHDVTVYGGDAEIPEGELWIKRNAIRLSRRAALSDSIEVTSKPFFLFSDNCSEKEDFYFAILQNQERNGNDDNPTPLVQHYETKHIIGLVQRLHSSEEQLQTRWFNALLGRLFLSVYKTQDLERIVRMKITKKISRVKKPGFLSGITLQKIDLGDAAPFITNPRLKDLTVDGDCCVEADVKYDGKFRIEIATTARIELGARFKAREVNLVLSITLKKLEGHIFIRFKPPPSNRLWFTFEKMPSLDLHIEPIVSSRQITYNVILRAIESRIREVLAETLVMPHWDDAPFSSTAEQFFRGGIWVNERKDFQPPTENIVPDEHVDDENETPGRPLKVPGTPTAPEDEKSQNAPAVLDGQKQRLFSRRGNASTPSIQTDHSTASSSSVQKIAELPKAIKSSRFATAAGPVTSTDNINSDPVRKDIKRRSSKDAASIMTELSNRSQPSSPGVVPPTPDDSFSTLFAMSQKASSSKTSSLHSSDAQLETGEAHPSRTDLGSHTSSEAGSALKPAPPEVLQSPTRFQSIARTLTPSEKKQQSLGAAALAAKQWSWKTLSKAKTATPDRLGTPDNPIGRGQPLPPPGQPLPPPEKHRAASVHVPARKAIPPKLPDRPAAASSAAALVGTAPASAPLQRTSTARKSMGEPTPEAVFVVAAPADSEPSSPVATDDDEYGEFMDNVRAEDEGEASADGTADEGEVVDHVTADGGEASAGGTAGAGDPSDHGTAGDERASVDRGMADAGEPSAHGMADDAGDLSAPDLPARAEAAPSAPDPAARAEAAPSAPDPAARVAAAVATTRSGHAASDTA